MERLASAVSGAGLSAPAKSITVVTPPNAAARLAASGGCVMTSGRPEVMTQPPEAASRAAAFGGVTTVIDFAGALNPAPETADARRSILEEVETRRQVFRDHAYTD